MTDFRTREDVKAHYVERMGDELGRLFHELWQDVAALRIGWGEFVKLFGEKPGRVDLMNEAAPAFFGMVQGLLWEETMLGISRLTDPPSSAGKDNLTIRRLAGCIDHEATAQEVTRCTEEAVEAAQFCRDWRNRRIAHRNLALATKRETAAPLEPGNRAKVEAALSAIERALNATSDHFTGATTPFGPGSRPGGALSLLHVLKMGAKAKAERRARLERGEPTPEDLRHEDI